MSSTQSSLSQLTHEEADGLLKKVNEQIAIGTLDTGDRELLQQMVEGMGDTRGMVRLGFAEALGAVGKPATPLLIEAVAHHPNVVVRRASAKTLTLIADPEAIPTLLHALLNDDDTVVKGSAVGALASIGERAIPVLLDVLAAPENSESIKGHVAWALAFIGAPGKEQLYAAIESDSAEVRAAVVGAIANFAEETPEERAFEVLTNALADEAENVRSEAAAALGKFAHKPAVPQLTALLHHDDGETRKAAALALMKIGDLASIEPLKEARDRETEEGIRRAIALAISLLEKRQEEERSPVDGDPT
ncbi:HEAT repeat domain-containing protein [Oscillatoriales cyanobacterium LEGE 11467]|uniref:HEAT repeat domain-containing protein n=1 Tax=Zarconia navalis LEGE 11467 TaxID=1828826 RepID=A0A928VT31_9CYAN|nr:HEAT repeat domain-containing protein [Zarconia navalis]MBE9039762.1 HEAT repeat domain-containing protein [Zarconia navalis LEGE 11467]